MFLANSYVHKIRWSSRIKRTKLALHKLYEQVSHTYHFPQVPFHEIDILTGFVADRFKVEPFYTIKSWTYWEVHCEDGSLYTLRDIQPVDPESELSDPHAAPNRILRIKF